MAGVPAAPRVLMASASSAFRRCGVRLACSASLRAWKALWASARQSTSTKNGSPAPSALGRCRGEIRRHSRWTRRRGRPSRPAQGHPGWVRFGLRRRASAAATRPGPRRLTCTASSSAESKLTVAAECTAMSTVLKRASPASSRPRPSWPTSPFTANTRRSHISSKVSPSRPPARRGPP